MIPLHKLIRRGIALVIVLPLLHGSLWSQTDTTIHEGILHVKVTSAVGKQFNLKKLSKSSAGEVVTGFAALDRMNKTYQVTDFRRMFPHAGKNEVRHQKYGLDRWYVLTLKARGKEREAVRAYQSAVEIEAAEPVYKKIIDRYGAPRVVRPTTGIYALPAFELTSGSNDPLLPQQWHYRNTGQTGGTIGADIKLIEAWKRETGNPQVIVAITDGGIEISHPDLRDNLWVNGNEVPGNGIDDDQNGYIDDINGFSFIARTGWIEPHYHGTHVAGIIAAVTNNSAGVAGIAGGSGNKDGVRLMSCEVFNDYYWAPDGFAESIVYAADNGALISQNSWGYPEPDMYEQVVFDAIDYFVAEAGNDSQGNQTGLMDGGMVIFSAGNDGSEDKYYPAYYPAVFAVASTNMRDVRAYYSNFGSWVDIAAPGGEVISNTNQAILSTTMGASYGYLMGTSMACPQVSGVAALVISKFGGPGFSARELETRLKASAENIYSVNPGYVDKLGSGRIDAAKALAEGGTLAPDAIGDLHATALDVGKISLAWTVPQDEDSYVAQYDVRFSPNVITESNFNLATRAGEFPASASVGQVESVTIGVPGPMTLYFAVRSFDFDGNTSLISNVISYTTKISAKLSLSVSEIVKQLQTAQTATETFRIYNKGIFPLQILIPDSVKGEGFVTCAPFKGTIAPARHMDIKVNLDANGMAAGIHEHPLKVFSNDPLSPAIVKISLTVVANGSPIAELSTDELNYFSLQLGGAANDTLRIHNAGSDPLKIHKIAFASKNFSSPVSSVTIAPFEDFLLPVNFKPMSLGIFREVVQLHTNDPKHSLIRIRLVGESLKDPPIVISPASLDFEVDHRSPLTKTFSIKNNGSFDRHYQLKLDYTQFIKPDAGASEFVEPTDENMPTILNRRQQLMARIESGDIKIDSAHVPFGKLSVQDGNFSRETALTPWPTYTTNFEEFRPGPVNGQNAWFGMQGWNVEQSNPDIGLNHLRGLSVTEEGTFALSPEMGFNRWCPVFSARVNTDNLGNSTWYIVPQEIYAIITILRLNPDRTIDVEDMPIDEYYWEWKRLDVELPDGYFDLTVAVEAYGYTYGEHFLNIFSVYIDDKRVHTGFTMGHFVNNVAFVRPSGSGNGTLDVDSIMIRRGQYIPKHIELPGEGVVRARENKNISLDIDPTGLKFGVYESVITASLEKMVDNVIPVAVQVVGDARIKFFPEKIYGDTHAMISNPGGENLVFTIDELPGVIGETSGTLAPEHYYIFNIRITGYTLDSLTIRSNAIDQPVLKIPVVLGGPNPNRRIYFSTKRLDFELSEGQTAQETILISGTDFPHFRVMAENLPSGISVDNIRGSVDFSYVPLTVKLDAALLDGRDSILMEIRTDAYETPTTTIAIHYDVSSKKNTADITQELWRNVPGTKVSDIPLNTSPSEINVLTSLMSPQNRGDLYGSRIRGYITAPYSGDYTFWISSNDGSELWLSTDKAPGNIKRIAYVENGVSVGDYKSYASQKSATISLQANRKYYIEILHKADIGLDHLSVGWQMPNHKREFPIPGKYLSRYAEPAPTAAVLPSVNFLAPFDGELFAPPADIDVTIHAVFETGVIDKVELYNGPVKLGEDLVAPYSFSLVGIPEGVYFLHARVHAKDVSTVVSASRTVVVSNTLSDWFRMIYPVDLWENVAGGYVSQIPLNIPPTNQFYNTGYFAQYGHGENYGKRIRGYFCYPETTTLVFQIASADRSELWFSTDEKSEHKQRIAYVPEPTDVWQYNAYPVQRSSPVTLIGRKVYYVEVLFKKGTGFDHLGVEWFPVESATATLIGEPQKVENTSESMVRLSIYPNPATQGFTTLRLMGLSDSRRPATWSLISLTGNVVLSGEFNSADDQGEMTIPLSGQIMPGVYVVRVACGDRKMSARLMIAK